MHEDLVAAPDAIYTDNRVKEEESQKVLVIMQSNALIDPHTVMVKLVGAPIASLAVLRVLEHMSVTRITVERVVVRVKLGLSHLVFFCLPIETLESHRRVSWITSSDKCRPNDHV